MRLKTMHKTILLIIIVLIGLVSIFFIRRHFNKNLPCGLENQNNVCWANASIQCLVSSSRLFKFIMKQTKHKNLKIVALANLFTKYQNNATFDPLSFYKEIFKGTKNEIDGKPNSSFRGFAILANLILENFPAENFFFSPQLINFYQLSTFGVFLPTTAEERGRNFLIGTLSQIPDVNDFPKIVCLNFKVENVMDEITEPFHSTITFKNKVYRLSSILIETINPERDRTGIEFHVYAIANINSRWYEINDLKVTEIREDQKKSQIYQNKKTKFAVYTLVEDGKE